MLGDTLTVTLPVGGAKVLNKINQDGYTSEYFLKGTLSEYRAKVRHSTATSGGVTRERHNVEFTEKVYATATVAEYVRKVYLVFENVPNDVDDDNVLGFVALFDAAFVEDLVGWES
jgi:imidazole glycerol phosphate synthase subunit HisF